MPQARKEVSVTEAVSAARARVRDEFGRWVEELERLVRIPSVSASPQAESHVRESAEAVADLFRRIGFEDVKITTAGGAPPAVIATWTEVESSPTVLLYAHHDVQPPGFLDRWSADPFEPVQRDGRLYGRGAADDKAGVVAHAAALAAWFDTAGGPPCNVKVVVEGEEEVGSPHLADLLAAHAEELSSDVMVLADAGNWSVGVPAITYSLRGLAGGVLRLRGLRAPVHSGLGGGVLPDPAMALAKVLASLTDDHGDVSVPGFSDDVRTPSESELRRVGELGDVAAAFRAAFGVLEGVELVGDPSRHVFERLWFRPAVTVLGVDTNPIEGSSNQIVARAAARISFRIAPGQDPARLHEVLRRHFASVVPWGLEWEWEEEESVPAWVCEPEGWAFDAMRWALSEAFGREPVLMGMGATIPFVGPFAQAFGGVPALLVGAADPTSAIHSEDESVHLDDLRRLAESETLFLEAVASGSSG